MYYLNSRDVNGMKRDWIDLTNIISHAVECMQESEFAQPVKPYLRYRNLANRIIAMPAFLGGDINMAGIKWIASFPGNIDQQLNRAHSVTILNNADTGVPICAINTTLVSGIRTAAVSGVLIRKKLAADPSDRKYKVGIVGFGPIGRLHLEMVAGLLGNQLDTVKLYDIRTVDPNLVPDELASKVELADSWQEAYADADIFITCTVSPRPYINLKPKAGSLQLNVSLRDYESSYMHNVDTMIVDDWTEVCREKTDIEMMHLNEGLKEEDTLNLVDVVCGDVSNRFGSDKVVMFNPMGMAIFDIAVGSYYYRVAQQANIGALLED